MSKETEEWRDIKGYEGLYQVSDWGRVKALKRNVVGKGRNQYDDEHILKLHKSIFYGKKRVQTALHKNGVKKYPIVARLVYETFVGDIPENMQVNHIDENPSNNFVENLNLMTPKQNSNWGTRNERISKAQLNDPSKSKKVDQIDLATGEIIATYPSAKEAARQLGFAQSNISRCCNGGFSCKNKWINVNNAYGYIWRYKNDQPN